MIHKFPTDRIVYFSDAVFAIAITLLIIELKVPPREEIQHFGTWVAIKEMIPDFVGFFVSFLVTALYWRSHLTHSHFIKNFDSKLVWLNIWLLMFVVILPFSTAFYSQNFSFNGPFVFYCANLAIIAFFSYWSIQYIVKKEGYSETLTREVAEKLKFRAITPVFVWLLSIVVAFIDPLTSRFTFLLIFIIQGFADWRNKKKSIRLSK